VPAHSVASPRRGGDRARRDGADAGYHHCRRSVLGEWTSAGVVCVLSELFIVASFFVVRALNKLVARAPGFRSTLAELEKDRACFQPRD
jgi:hypothetical protein